MISSNYARSSYCCLSNCVEVRLHADGMINLRNSGDGRREPLAFTPSEWRAFLDGVRNGEFDLPEPD